MSALAPVTATNMSATGKSGPATAPVLKMGLTWQKSTDLPKPTANAGA